MKKWILFGLIIFNVQLLLAQKREDTNQYITVNPGFSIKRSGKINAYADSINNYAKELTPIFILDECFELDNQLWRSFHPSTSVRWEILEKVNNKKALRTIMHTFRKKLKRKCSYERIHVFKLTIPTADTTFYQLMKKRYKQL